MASAWGKSWGAAWDGAWHAEEAVPTITPAERIVYTLIETRRVVVAQQASIETVTAETRLVVVSGSLRNVIVASESRLVSVPPDKTTRFAEAA